MSSVHIRLDDELSNRLELVAKSFERSKGHIARKALEAYLLELEEDLEDYNDAVEVLNNSTGETIAWEDIKREYGLED